MAVAHSINGENCKVYILMEFLAYQVILVAYFDMHGPRFELGLIWLYSRTSMARTPFEHENMSETGIVRGSEC